MRSAVAEIPEVSEVVLDLRAAGELPRRQLANR